VYYPNEWHWNANGQRAAAQVIVGALRQRGLIDAGCGQ
jgi:hypothetical protein